MSEDKLCPFMSRPVIDEIQERAGRDGPYKVVTSNFHTVHCQKERCAAWGFKVYEKFYDGESVEGCRLIP